MLRFGLFMTTGIIYCLLGSKQNSIPWAFVDFGVAIIFFSLAGTAFKGELKK